MIAPLAWVVLYLPSLDFRFVWEDEGAIAAGTLLRPAGETLAAFREPLHRIEYHGASTRQAYYRPLPVAALSLIDQRFGRAPRNFRAFTIAAGALCAAAFGGFAGFLLGRGEEARAWLARARASAPADANLLGQVQAIESSLERPTALKDSGDAPR